MSHEIAVIGDNFMLSDMFRDAIIEACDDAMSIRCTANEWPDVPMLHGYAAAGLDELKEYYGDPDEVCDFIGNADILVTHLAPMSRDMMARLPALKLIAVSRGGPVNIDMQAARDNNIRVVNTPGRNAGAVAEFTIGAILAETRRIREGHEALRQGIWRGDLYRADRAGRELSELTIGVIGYGAIGTRVVRLLRAFNANIVVADPYVQLSPEDSKAGVKKMALEELLATSDVVTLHPRVTPETKHIINAETLAQMQPGSVLVNTARGPLLDYAALLSALESGHLSGAMLETFDIEPAPEDSPLLKHPNVTLTPHIAGASVNTVKIAASMVGEEVRRFAAGEPPLNAC